MDRKTVVLIVDDDPIGRRALKSILSGEDYELALASGGAEALEIAKEILPDVVLLDVMMPGMDGFEVTRKIRGTPVLSEVPILLLTALDDPRSRLEGISDGADDFISKPYDVTELRARVRNVSRLNRFRLLLKERERHRLLFERSPCALLVINEESEVQEANTVANALLERVCDETTPRTLQRVVPLEDAPRLRYMLSQAKADPDAKLKDEFRVHDREGNPLWLELSLSLFSTAGENNYQVAVRDLTAERHFETELRHAQKTESIGQLTNGIAHDFNNLLTIINGFSELILSQETENTPTRQMVEEIHKAGGRAAALTNQLLVFGRKELGGPVILDLNALVTETGRILPRLLGENIRFEEKLSPSVGRIKADPRQIERVLLNMASNARDAMPNGGVLTIATESLKRDRGSETTAAAKNGVRLIVSDTGCGMTPQVLRRIFEPFYTTKGQGKGTGLGLANVGKILQEAGCKIEAFSEPGQGTKFVLDFQGIDGEPDTTPTPRRVEKGVSRTQTVLVVDDEESVRGFCRAVLESYSYKVLEASSGAEALRISRDHNDKIHLLLTDFHMPGQNGGFLAEAMLAERPDLRVIYCSVHEKDIFADKARIEEAFTFLRKPFSIDDLLQSVKERLR